MPVHMEPPVTTTAEEQDDVLQVEPDSLPLPGGHLPGGKRQRVEEPKAGTGTPEAIPEQALDDPMTRGVKKEVPAPSEKQHGAAPRVPEAAAAITHAAAFPVDGPQHLVWVRVTSANFPSLEDNEELYFVYPRRKVLPKELAPVHMVALAADDPQLAVFPVVQFADMKRRKRPRPQRLTVTTEEEAATVGWPGADAAGSSTSRPLVANLYCDGACAANGTSDASAAAAAVYEHNAYPPVVRKLDPAERNTNVTAEWQAAELALQEIVQRPERFADAVCVHTDHRAIVSTLQGGVDGEGAWLEVWANNATRLGIGSEGYVKGDGTPPKNLELILRVAAVYKQAAQLKTLRLEWVKGHNGHPFQEQADKLASSAARNTLDTRYTEVRPMHAPVASLAAAAGWKQ